MEVTERPIVAGQNFVDPTPDAQKLQADNNRFLAELKQNVWGGIGMAVLIWCIGVLSKTWDIDYLGISGITYQKLAITSAMVGGMAFGLASIIRFLSDDIVQWYQGLHWKGYKRWLEERVAEMEGQLAESKEAERILTAENSNLRAQLARAHVVAQERRAAAFQEAAPELDHVHNASPDPTLPINSRTTDPRFDHAMEILQEWRDNPERPGAYSRESMTPKHMSKREWALAMGLLVDVGIVGYEGRKRVIVSDNYPAALEALNTYWGRIQGDREEFVRAA